MSGDKQFGKNFFNSKPMPRIIGKAMELPGGGWTWNFDIYVGTDYLTSMQHNPQAPAFLSKEGAIADMKERVMEVSKVIAKEAYDVPDDKLGEINYLDLKDNTMKSILT